MPRRQFSMLRACFWLLAVLLMTEILMTVFGGISCWWFNATGAREIGACLPIVAQIREQWAESLAAILALLLAARSDPPPPNEEE
jgi:hypothetical protein